MTLRTNYNDGGATPLTSNVTASDMNAISTQVNTNTTTTAPRLAAALAPGVPNVALTVNPSPPTVVLSGPGGASPVTSPTNLPYNTSQVTLKGGALWRLVTQFSTNYYQNGDNDPWTPGVSSVAFNFYGSEANPDFAIYLQAESSGLYWLFVDGMPCTAAPQPNATNPGSLYYLHVTFSAPGFHQIELVNWQSTFGGIDYHVVDTIWPNPPKQRKSIAFLGDSLVEGAIDVDTMRTWPWYTARFLDMNPYLLGQGGTGFVATASSRQPYTGSTRLAALAATNADVVILNGSANDDGLSGIQAAAQSVITSVQSSLPNAMIILLGPAAASTTIAGSTNRVANDAAIQAAASATGVHYISRLSYITGTGFSGSPAGNGNADAFINTDDIHPTLAGAQYFGMRTALDIKNYLATI